VLVIGLTGGIGSGKTTVARRFAAHGVPVLDADEIARELVEPGQPALIEIAERFGADILEPSGRLDRARLRHIVFADPGRRRTLEGLLHPRVREAMEGRIGAMDAPYCVLCIPLLLESGMRDLVDRILVVDAPEQLQYRRTRERDRLSEQEIRAILRAQTDRGERLAAAHEVIVNDAGLEQVYAQVEALHDLYNRMAMQSRR
jgi:dephospho-CoA kinase